MPTKKRPAKSTLSARRLAEMTEEATVDAYGEGELQGGWFTKLDEHLSVPFETVILGVEITVEKLEMDHRDEIVAVCARAGKRVRVPILEVPLPDPPPEGAEWIEAYRHWRKREGR